MTKNWSQLSNTLKNVSNLTEKWNSSLLTVARGSAKWGRTLALYCKWAAPLEWPPAEYWWRLLCCLTLHMLWFLSRCIIFLAITVTWSRLGIHYHHHSWFLFVFFSSLLPSPIRGKRYYFFPRLSRYRMIKYCSNSPRFSQPSNCSTTVHPYFCQISTRSFSRLL